MAYTLGDITTRVQQRVRDTGYPSTEIVGYINDAQNDIFNEYRLPFMQTTQDYTVTIGEADISDGTGLPANYVQAIDLLVTTDGSESLIPYMPFREIDGDYPDAADTDAHPSGGPRYWYYYGETIKLYPSPDKAYTLKLRYYKRPTEITSDDSVPEVPSEFREVLIMGAAYRVLQVKDNYDQASVLQNKYDEILQKLVMRYSQPQIGVATRIRINRRPAGKQYF